MEFFHLLKSKERISHIDYDSKHTRLKCISLCWASKFWKFVLSTRQLIVLFPSYTASGHVLKTRQAVLQFLRQTTIRYQAQTPDFLRRLLDENKMRNCVIALLYMASVLSTFPLPAQEPLSCQTLALVTWLNVDESRLGIEDARK